MESMMISKKSVFLFLALLMASLWGQMSFAQNAQPPMATPPAAQAPATATGVYEYRLGSGDKIRMLVFGEEKLGGEFMIAGDGKVSLPLIGDMHAAGLTAAEFQANIVAAYKQGYLNDPKVNIEVLSFRPFYILGEVNRPGEYPYSNGITVVNAVALAQGFTYRANQKKVYIRHANEVREQQVPLTSSLQVAPGDTVRISERYF
ncbi:hypothetical protein AEAC466_21475 [Asticcacaulis sp. AC466]|nr:hypothetical protein AEAC466_21475 [Asticcacaulis sp. AC466]